MKRWQELKNKWQKQISEEFSWWGLAGTVTICTLLSLAWSAVQKRPPDPALASREEIDPTHVDTYIPDGKVLVPISIINSSSLDSLLGHKGVVDLYLPPLDPKESPKLILKAARILRAPLNSNEFSVLVRANEAPELVSPTGQYFAVVHNPNKSGTKFVKRQRLIVGDKE